MDRCNSDHNPVLVNGALEQSGNHGNLEQQGQCSLFDNVKDSVTESLISEKINSPPRKLTNQSNKVDYLHQMNKNIELNLTQTDSKHSHIPDDGGVGINEAAICHVSEEKKRDDKSSAIENSCSDRIFPNELSSDNISVSNHHDQRNSAEPPSGKMPYSPESFTSKVKSETKLLNIPQDVRKSDEVSSVVGEKVIPKNEPSTEMTSTTLSLSNTEVVDRTEISHDKEISVLTDISDKPVASLSRDADFQSSTSQGPKPSPSSAKSEGNAQHSPLIDLESTSPQIPTPSKVEPNFRDSKSTSSQKITAKSRGNTLVFVPDLSDELMQAYRILTGIFGDKCKSFVWPFLEQVDTKSLWDYEERIKHPMWLRKIESKFLSKEYVSITEFATDVRQILENCYRYNGMKHQISKYAQTLECVFEQKLALLSRPLQEKTTLYVTSKGKYNDGCPNTIELSSGRLRRSCTRLVARAIEKASATPLAFHIGRELELKEREDKRQKIVDRRDEIIKERNDLLEWDKHLIGEPNWTNMKSIWEIPAIGHFLSLCQTVLELDEISFFELERSFALPMESMMLRRIFTTLLSTPYQRTRLAKKPPMPYKVWEARLREWVRGWYVVLEKLGDPTKVYEKIGVPERFFEVLGSSFPLDRVQYHELTYYERVWILKGLCDQLFETQMIVRRCVLSQPVDEQRPIILGIDGESNSYIHFPQFCGADLRIYRQKKYPDLLKKTKKEKEAEMEANAKDDIPTPNKQRKTPKSKKITTKPKPAMETPRARPSRLRQRLIPTVHFGSYPESVISSTGSEDVTSEFTEMDDETDETDSQVDQPTTSRTVVEAMDTEEESENASSIIVSENEDNGDEDKIDDCKKLSLDGNEEEKRNKQLEQSQTSKTEEIQPICNGEVSVTSSSTDGHQEIIEDTEKNNPSLDNGAVNQSAESNRTNCPSTNPEGKSETLTMEGDSMNVSTNKCSQSVDTPGKVNPDNDPQATPMDTSEESVNTPLDTPVGNGEAELAIPPSSPCKPHVEVLPILGEFELVCDSMDSLRELVAKFGPPSSQESCPTPPPVTGRKRKAVTYKKQPPRKRCEKELHEKLTNLLLELTPWESKLAKFAIRSREKLKKEFEAAQLIPETDQDIKDIWASEESSSESESSDSDSEEEQEDTNNDEDEEWDGMKLRKRSRKKVPLGDSQQDEYNEETPPGSVNDETLKKSNKNRSSKRSSQDGNKRSPPHKNQINTSLMELIKHLSTDGLKEATRRLQTMIKRGEAGRNQKYSKSKMSSVSHFSGSGDGKSLRKLLNKSFWSFAKPPSVEGTVAQTVEELISLYPIYVLNVIFRNLKTSLAKIVKAKQGMSHEFHIFSTSKETNSGERSEAHDIPPEKPSQQEVEDSHKAQSNSPNKLEKKFSLVTRPQQEVVKLSAKPKTKEVMDDIVLEGLYGVLALTKQLLKEHLATGLSELLPDYLNLQESVSKPPPPTENKDSVNSSLPAANRTTDKELLLKMLPKPSQYLTGTNLTPVTSGLKLPASHRSTNDTSATTTQSIVVPVPTSKLPLLMPMNSIINNQTKFIVKDMNVLQTSATPKTSQTGQSQASASTSSQQHASSKGAVPQGVYTIKVDANVWSQLQGKPELQQQFVLQQIKEMQQKQQTLTGGSVNPAIKGSLNTPAQTVTCIRSLPKVTAPKTTPQVAIKNASPQITSRVAQGKSATQSTAVRPSQHPGKLIQHPKPKTQTKSRSSTKEPVSNLSQKELIALLQQQQRQLELHRQQQQQKLLLKKKEEQQRLQQQQQQQQHFVIGSSGVLVSTVQPQLLQAAGIPARTAVPTAVHISSHKSNTVTVSGTNTWTAGQPTVCQPVSLSTNTTVTASVNRPKMSVNLTESNCTNSQQVKVAALPVVSQTSIASLPGGPHNLSQNPGNRIHLIQTGKGGQILLQTGSSQTPKLVGLSSSINVPNSGSTVPVILTGQNTQLIQQVVTHPLQVASTSTVVNSQQNVQGVQLLLSPTQPNSSNVLVNTPQTVLRLAQPKQALQVRANSNQPVEQAIVPILGGNAVLNHNQSVLNHNQSAVMIQQGSLENVQGTRGQMSTLFPQATAGTIQRQASPVVIQKPQLQIVKGDGNPKVVIGNPTKLVRLVHPSQLSTATKFIATPEQGQTGSIPFGGTESVKLGSKGLQILTQAPGGQQLLCLPVQQSKMVATPPSNPGTSSGQMDPSNNIQQQQQLQKVILGQLTSGKLTMSSVQAGAQFPTEQVHQKQTLIQHLNPANITLSQQAPQIVPNLQQSTPFNLLQQSIPVQLLKKPLGALASNCSLLNHQLPVQLPKSGGDGRAISTDIKSSFQQPTIMTSVAQAAGDGTYLQPAQTLVVVPSTNTPQLISQVTSQQKGLKRVSQTPPESGVGKTARLAASIQTPSTS